MIIWITKKSQPGLRINGFEGIEDLNINGLSAQTTSSYSGRIDFNTAQIHPNQQMPFRFTITKPWNYTPGKLAEITTALEFAGNKVQNAYEFEHDIYVDVQFVNLSNTGAAARSGPTGMLGINDASYPFAIAKQRISTDQWERLRQNIVPEYDIEMEICYNTPWYLGTDQNKAGPELDMVSTIVHELHHGLGWLTPYMEIEGGEDGEAYRIVRENKFPINAFEKFLCYRTSSGKICPISDHYINYNTRMDAVEKARREETLATILQSNDVFFYDGNSEIRVYAPAKFSFGSSIIHIDFGVEPDGVMEPFITDGNAEQHEIGTLQQQITTHMRNPNLPGPDSCDCKELPVEKPKEKVMYGHERSNYGAVPDVIISRRTRAIAKSRNGLSKAVNSIKGCFRIALRLDVQFTARLQMVNFDTKPMQFFTGHQKESGIIVHHRQNVEVDGVSLLHFNQSFRRWIYGIPKHAHEGAHRSFQIHKLLRICGDCHRR